ncbi:MAG: four-carbon acid sugar kinase family protein [Proteobacteria bacterium]|nr:four-carbon acid sugar kinase family protein [Pseudomonadota bacterium]
MLLGCIADDFTGATDLANTLVREGMSTVVVLGVPRPGGPVPDTDAVIVALKSRSIPAADAIKLSLEALEWLKRGGTKQYYFKYCSTFDSTDAGNIGPVAEALLVALDERFTVACPAFPTNKRTIYQGNLFVGDQLLSESSMRHHPLNPMTDASLVRVLQRQCKGKVGLVPFNIVEQGAEAIRAEMKKLAASDSRHAIVDAITDQHLLSIGTACADMKLLTGGSGLALGLPENFRRQGLLKTSQANALPHIGGHAIVLSGSCSAATQRQVAEMKKQCESFGIDALALARGDDVVQQALAWAQTRLGDKPVLIYSTAAPQQIEAVQAAVGRERAGSMVEQALSEIAKDLVARGTRRLVVAGGETSGAVVTALGIDGLRVGPEIEPGVPWTASVGDKPIALALKSGNFGSDDFFLKAFQKIGTADERR